MNKQALFSDGTSQYLVPSQPKEFEVVTIRFRAMKDEVETVRVMSGSRAFVMQKAYTEGVFDYFELNYELSDEPFKYYFEVTAKEGYGCREICYYDRSGVTEKNVDEFAFEIVPGFATPDWAKGAVMYQIFVDRFFNGDRNNDVESGEYIYIDEPCVKVTNWSKDPAYMGVREFYGGDLQGVWDKLDYLQDLGVEVIYFNPLFVSPSNHKYDTQDYDHIDPHFGKIIHDGGEVLASGVVDNRMATKYQQRVASLENLNASNEFFAQLVEEIHRRGMKVIMDGVFNHCGSFNKWLDREKIYEGRPGFETGAYISKDSPYHTFFSFEKKDENAWPDNKSYVGWWDFNTLPKLNYEDSEILEEYILGIAKKWVSPPFNVDGWRLDVAADLGQTSEYNHAFWRKFRKVVKEANPDAIILAEHYGSPSPWLRGDQWDTVMNYDAFMEPITWFLTGMEKHSDALRLDLLGNPDHFIGSMKYHMSHMLAPSLMVAMNELSNHDHSRFLTRTNRVAGRVANLGHRAAEIGVKESVMREAVVMQMTWIGAPTLYYGDEAGVCGFTDPDNRRTYPWGNENKELLAFHKEAIRIHRESTALRSGSIEILHGEHEVISYARFNETEKVVVVVNNGHPKDVVVPVWQAEVPLTAKMERLLYTCEEGYTIEAKDYAVERGKLPLHMDRNSAIILRYKL